MIKQDPLNSHKHTREKERRQFEEKEKQTFFQYMKQCFMLMFGGIRL